MVSSGTKDSEKFNVNHAPCKRTAPHYSGENPFDDDGYILQRELYSFYFKSHLKMALSIC